MDRLANGQELPNPLDETLLHEHTCKNCQVRFFCALPDCGGGWADPELCPDCERWLDGIW